MLEADNAGKALVTALYRGHKGRITVGDYHFDMNNLADAAATIDDVMASLKRAARYPQADGAPCSRDSLEISVAVPTDTASLGWPGIAPYIRRMMHKSAKRIVSRLPLLLAVVAALLFVALGGTRYVGLSELAGNFRWMRDTADAAGEAAPLLFVAANIAVLMLLVVPSWFCTIAAGLLFGRWFGTLYALIGTTAGAATVFLMARSGLGGLADRGGPQVASIARALRADAILYLVFMRLLPIFPFTLVNVVAALAGLRLGTFLIGTVIGIVPSIVIYASIGDLLMELTRRGTLPDTNLLREPRFFLPLLGLAALALLPIVVRRWRR